MNPDLEKLVEYRLRQARDTLAVAGEVRHNGHFRDAVNRAYYAIFYASLGLLASKMLGSSKHSGVIGLFGKNFVKTGQFRPETAKYLREAFDLRQRTDYREFVDVTADQTDELIEHAAAFITEAEELWTAIKSDSGPSG